MKFKFPFLSVGGLIMGLGIGMCNQTAFVIGLIIVFVGFINHMRLKK